MPEDRAAKIWLQVIGGEDVKLPEECVNVGAKRKREEKAEVKGQEEELKQNNPEKRPKTDPNSPDL